MTARIYRAAIEKYGVPNQVNMVIEEAGELIAELPPDLHGMTRKLGGLVASLNQYFSRNRGTLEKVAEETADMIIMLEQLRLIIGDIAGNDLVGDFQLDKIERLAGRLKCEF